MAKVMTVDRENLRFLITDINGEQRQIPVDNINGRCVYCQTKHNATEKNCGNCGAVL